MTGLFWRLLEGMFESLATRCWEQGNKARAKARLRGEKIDGWPAHFEMRRNGRG